MLPPSLRLRRFACIIFGSLLGLGMSEPLQAAAEQPTRLDPYQVDETPFGHLGLNSYAYFIGINYLVGGTPSTPWIVYGVYAGSPAHRAGIVVGDQIMAINGESVEKISRRQIRKLFGDSTAGTSVELELHNEFTPTRRKVTLKFETGKTWSNSTWLELDYWGLRARIELPAKLASQVLGNFGKRPKGIWHTGPAIEIGLAAHRQILRLTRRTEGRVAITRGREQKESLGEFGSSDRITIRKDGTIEVMRRRSETNPDETTVIFSPDPSSTNTAPRP